MQATMLYVSTVKSIVFQFPKIYPFVCFVFVLPTCSFNETESQDFFELE